MKKRFKRITKNLKTASNYLPIYLKAPAMLLSGLLKFNARDVFHIIAKIHLSVAHRIFILEI